MSLVERDDEFGFLKRLFEDCARGRSRVGIVSGTVASGKTELLQALLEYAAEREALVLSAVGSRAEQALPMGVVEQLFSDCSRLRTVPFGLLAGKPGPNAQEDGSGAYGHAFVELPDSHVAQELCTALLELARSSPLVIAIDDVHYADSHSLQTLLYFIRRCKAARVLVVFSELAHPRSVHPLFHAELLRQPHCHRVWLSPLSPRGVEDVLEGALEPDVARSFASECHRLSGGNPLLVKALIEDYWITVKTGRAGVVGRLAPATAFRDAVLACLHRCDDATLDASHGLAVLDTTDSTQLIHRFLGVRGESIAPILHVLSTAGLIGGDRSCRFRHEATRSAVLDSLSAEQLAQHHVRAARVLHDHGRPATDVAAHLVAAGVVPGPWAIRLLREAARHALRRTETRLAVDCLELARRCCTDERERAALTAALADVEWQSDPYTAARHFPDLIEALYAGHLVEADVHRLAWALAWHGRIDDAVTALQRLRTDADAPGTDSAEALRTALQSVAHLYPEQLATLPRPVAGRQPGGADPAANVRRQAGDALTTVLTAGGGGARADERVLTDAAQEAELALQRSHLDAGALAPVIKALFALIYADRLGSAEAWCSALLRETARPGAAFRQASLFAVRAEIALRRGSLLAARDHAESALAAISAEGWGAVISFPFSSYMLASTARGAHDDVAALLRRGIPEPALHSRYGVHYVYARGQHYLATNRPHGALGEFLRCGDLVKAWSIDTPSLVPWRTGAAEALLQLEERSRARQLAEEQLALIPRGPSRTRGMTLRVLAAADDVRHRPERLRGAVEMLEEAGDQYESACALAELSRSCYELGDVTRARMMAGKATALAEECAAEPVVRDCAPLVGHGDALDDEMEARALSDAERRVASLAAMGHTNREIGDKLFITISTVEQHLTRIYRKLDIGGRVDLPSLFPVPVPESP